MEKSNRILGVLVTSIFSIVIGLSANTNQEKALLKNTTPKATIYQSSERQTTMIELFTSQGCRSCLPADYQINKFLHSRKLWKDYIPMAFHLNYWDYLGWEDLFASPEFLSRHQFYYRTGKLRGFYIPAIVVNGTEANYWYDDRGFPDIYNDRPKVGKLIGKLIGSDFSVAFTSEKIFLRPLILHLTILGHDYEIEIKSGPNAPIKLKQDFVVLIYNTWENEIPPHPTEKKWEWDLDLTRLTIAPKVAHGQKKLSLALWVSKNDDFIPIQATGGWLPPEIYFKAREKKNPEVKFNWKDF